MNLLRTRSHELARTLFHAGVQSVRGDRAVERFLSDWPCPARIQLVAIGKAADSMCVGAMDRLGDALSSALVITKHGHAGDRIKSDPRIEWHLSLIHI